MVFVVCTDFLQVGTEYALSFSCYSRGKFAHECNDVQEQQLNFVTVAVPCLIFPMFPVVALALLSHRKFLRPSTCYC
jgi:hypothetical protein